MDPEEYRRKIEQNILKIMEEKLMNGEMSAQRAKEIARFVLDALHTPFTLEKIYEIVPTLDDHFEELTAAVLPVIQDHERQVKAMVADHAQKLIKSGKIDEAHAVLKQAIEAAKQ